MAVFPFAAVGAKSGQSDTVMCEVDSERIL
jgi:hypothetical protein